MMAIEDRELRHCLQNRELTWLGFNERVLEESNYAGNPLLERMKFIAIFSSNLDEFFMVRVGSLIDYMLFAPEYRDNKTGMSAEQQLDAIYHQVSSLYALRERCFAGVVEALAHQGVYHMNMRDMEPADCKNIEKYFCRNILPLLSPQIIDSRHPFPHIENKRLHIAAILEHKGKPLLGMIAIPKSLERVYPLGDGHRFVLLEDIIYHFCHLAFHPYKMQEKTVMAVTRNADINTEEDNALDEDIDYRQFMKALIKKRHRLAPVRLELQYAMSHAFNELICDKLSIKEKQLFLSSVPLDLSYCFALDGYLSMDIRKGLIRAPYSPFESLPAGKKANLMKQISEKDMLFSYPFESMSPFVEMIRSAADDPTVLSIKITFYRIDSQSRIAESLIRAAENGKEVIVLMELRARFDEANNIEWSQRLDEAGCRVIFGPLGYKVHSKICLITKKEFGRIHHITQIGTGNYNEKTAKQYTDFSLVTANREIGEDAAAFFNALLMSRIDRTYTHLWVAPYCLKQNILRSIEQEADKARGGEQGQIIIKCNSLTDREIISKLVEASRCGVKVSMLVRGICCLKPRVPDYTENITIISIVGRFLEHSRVFCFGPGGNRGLYISSADLMTRNTERRVEIACPILDDDIKRRIYGTLETMLMDNTKAWEQFADGRYVLRHAPIDMGINAQEIFIEQARTRAEHSSTKDRRVGKKADWLSPITSLRSKIHSFFS